MPHGIMFHHFSKENNTPNSQGAISANELARLIEYVGIQNILPAREWLERAEKGSLNSRDICLTFDDALMVQYKIALPVLEHYSLTAFWFVYTKVIGNGVEMFEVYRTFRTREYSDINVFYEDFFRVLENSKYGHLARDAMTDFKVEKYLADFRFYSDADRKFRFIRDQVLSISIYQKIMNLLLEEKHIDIKKYTADLWLKEKHLQELNSKAHVIGLHSHTHPIVMESLTEKKQKLEYKTNFSRLTKILKEKPASMSHPCNSYNKTTLSILKNLGIKVGFRANMTDSLKSNLEYPREDHINIFREMQK